MVTDRHLRDEVRRLRQQVRDLRRAQRNLSEMIVYFVTRYVVNRKRRPVDPAGDEHLRQLHDEQGKSYAFLARRLAMEREAVRAAVRRARRRRTK
jgi:hypothetical protein